MPVRTPKRLRMALVAASLLVGTTGCVTATDQMMMMSREQGAGRPDRALRIYEKYNRKGFEKSNNLVLRMACIAHLNLHDFDTHADCNRVVRDKKVFPPWNDIGGASMIQRGSFDRWLSLG